MATYAKKSHDISITDPSTTDVLGFNVAVENNMPVWEEHDGKYLVDLFGTGAPQQSYMNPEEYYLDGQSSWRSGFGLEYYDPGDPERYFKAIGMDMRFSGMGICGPTPTTITKPTNTAPTITNAGFETDVSPTSGFGWTQGAGTWSRVADAGHDGGTYVWREPTASDSDYIYQNLTPFARNCEYKISVWIKLATAAQSVKVVLNDGTNDYNGNSVTGTAGTWLESTVTATLLITATLLRFLVWVSSGQSNEIRVDHATITMSSIGTVGTTPRKGKTDFNDAHYVAFGKILAKLSSTSPYSSFIAVAKMGSDITCLAPFQVAGVDYLFIMLGTSATCYYMSTAETLTLSTTAVKTFQYAVWVHTHTNTAGTPGADTFFANDGVNTVRCTTNPLNLGEAWGDQTIVGDAANAIQDLISWEGSLGIPKKNNFYYMNKDGIIQNDAAHGLEALTCSTSGQNADIGLNGDIFYPVGSQGLARIATDSADNEWVTPAEYTRNNPDFNGRVQACAHDDQWEYVILGNDPKVEVMAGRDETINGTTKWVWHGSIAEITLAGCQTAWTSSIYERRLYIASTDADNALYYIPLYTGYGDVISDANRKFKTGVTLQVPFLHGGFTSEDKSWIKITLTMGHTYNAGRYFTVRYKPLGGSWVSISGNFDGSETSMVETKYLAAAGTTRTSPMMTFEFTAVTDDPDYTPILLDYKVKAVMYPEIKKIFFTKVIVDKDVVDYEGLTKDQHYILKKTCLDNARNATHPVTITDMDGTTRYVKFEPLPSGTPRRRVTRKEAGHAKAWEYNLLLLEIPLA